MMVDTAGSSSMVALDCALKAIQCNDTEAAIVGGVNLLLHPNVTLLYQK